ncbi:MAG: 16S rRNA (cytidine(1402)-2'-O)-methyltransferase [Cyclobacteriaceae bacterium]|nr:16S rRNA (cytidine(1402)-2'-O)-methyltransferase [Cyclobacteriaceae bacterium]
MSGTALYIVPTPIGNLADITFRALDVLKSVDIILAEDTRTSRVLLNHYNIERPLQSYHIFNEHQAVTRLIDRMKQGERFALISDAGTPGISDPGFLLVRETLKAGLGVDCLPGPTAFIPALIKSGFPTDRFVFEGFLPHKKGRQTALKQLAQEPRTIVLYESPHRLKKLIEELREHLGADRMISVSRELTKRFEETITGSVAEVQASFADREVKGEIVVVIHGQEN